MKLLSLFKKSDTRYTLPEGFTVTAHTGCEGTADNTIESINAGVAAGADIVEIDLHFLPDGTPVLKHDAPKQDENLPTLESAFKVLADLEVKMNVDVKATANIAAVYELSKKYGVTGKIFYTGIEEKDAPTVKSCTPEIPYYLNIAVDKKKSTDPDYLALLADKVRKNGAVGINANFKNCSGELVAYFKSEGLLSSLWTANSKREMYRCLSFEPDNITTRRPSLLRELLNK